MVNKKNENKRAETEYKNPSTKTNAQKDGFRYDYDDSSDLNGTK